MRDEETRRELEAMRKRYTDMLMGLTTRITTLNADLARLQKQRYLVICDIDTVNEKLREFE